MRRYSDGTFALLLLLHCAEGATDGVLACAGDSTTVQNHWAIAWPVLATKRISMLTRWVPKHLQMTEPFSVAAFIGAIEKHPPSSKPWILDIGANVGAYTLIAASLGARVLAVDLQPTCADLVRCHLSLSNLTTAEVFNAYVSPEDVTSTLSVPIEDCVKTASPTAVVGRFPTGFLSKKTKRAYLLPPSQLRQVPPLHVASLMNERLASEERFTSTKIDVEGYEIHVLEALRPAWSRLGDVLLEVQPRAWRWQNITIESGLNTLRQFVTASSYRIVSLTHTGHGDEIGKTASTFYPDVCKLPLHRGAGAVAPDARSKLTELDVDGFAELLRFMMGHPRKMGYFRDFLFTNRACS